MHRTRPNRHPHRATLASMAVASLNLFGMPAVAADDGAQRVRDFGCLNCHGSKAYDAPSFKDLGEKMAGEGDRPEARQDRLRDMRGHATIHTHQMVADESALAILQWLAQGAK